MDEHAPIVYDVTPYLEETKGWNSDPSAYLLRYYTKYYFLATDGKATTEKIIDQLTGLEVIRGDQYVYQSPNKLCITGLAPTHPLIAQKHRYKVLNVRFDSKIMAALPQPTAIPANSKKQPPPACHAETVICKIEAQDLEYVAPPSSENADMTDTATTTSVEEATKEGAIPEEAVAEETTSESTPVLSSRAQQRDAAKVKESVDPSRVMFVIRGAIGGHVMELNERLLRRGTAVITDPTVINTIVDKASTHGFIAVLRPKIDNTEIALEHLCPMDRYEAYHQ
ncbi:hypothetical protein EMPS_10432 [Entomortierella parvispora]|uniref:Uncharacterized protein n=1 Tax=Entomortierella parvispora TaxID=205924 RepID=A0A9P3HKA7_9FUNG|nr:hypothetical protein EMPS_10432 [Entomortierella parvispora]